MQEKENLVIVAQGCPEVVDRDVDYTFTLT